MGAISRREFVAAAASLGATAAWCRGRAWPSRIERREDNARFAEGVASGDPRPESILLWTRCPSEDGRVMRLQVEVAEDAAFDRVVTSTPTHTQAASDWTSRVLVGGLAPDTVYWYRFTDERGHGSRVGRTRTAPRDMDERPVRFAFVSCQNVTQGAQNAYRRMIFEDELAPPDEQLGFVLHLGDFIYELVWYPEDRPQGMYDRRLRDLIRYQNGEKISDFHIPTTVEDYRLAYRTYLHDPDLQDARARWPFVNMWDNHEFSWLGYQGLQIFQGQTRPAQTRKVAANQAWFEYQPARVHRPGVDGLDTFAAPHVVDHAVNNFDDHGLGQEANNLKAIGSLQGYRAVRWGRHVDLIITDQHTYRSEDPTGRPEAKPLVMSDFPDLAPEEAIEILDAGRTYMGNQPPEVISLGAKTIPNFRRNAPSQTMLGAEQKAWFLAKLKSSTATWKIWGNTAGTLEGRADPQNLPPELAERWPGAGYAVLVSGDLSNAYVERSEIYDFVKQTGITGFATIAGDRHSFWAGLAAKGLPPKPFDPVGVAFITGSLSAPGLVEAYEHVLPLDHPLRGLFLSSTRNEGKPQPTVNLLMHHGVEACLEFGRTGNAALARRLSNPRLAPHLSFLDFAGHGFATVRATAGQLECEFVCIERPLERSNRPDGGALVYRVVHRSKLWKAGEHPHLDQEVLEGNPSLSL
jgi:alkaline phosphatase D